MPVEKIVEVEVPYEKLVSETLARVARVHATRPTLSFLHAFIKQVVVEVPKVTTVVQDVPVPFRMPSERIEVKQVNARIIVHVHSRVYVRKYVLTSIA